MPPALRTNPLSEDAFLKILAAPMRNVTNEATDAIDIWPYVDAVPAADLRGHQVYDRFVEYVYRDATNRFDHVLVMTKTKNVYLTVVVDLSQACIHGHHLLYLNEKYGLSNRAASHL